MEKIQLTREELTRLAKKLTNDCEYLASLLIDISDKKITTEQELYDEYEKL